MFRWFLILLAVGIAGGVAYSNGWLNPYIEDLTGPPIKVSEVKDTPRPPPEIGDLLFAAEKLQPLPQPQPLAFDEAAIDFCHVVCEKVEVSSPRDGRLLFVGELVGKGAVPDPLRGPTPVRMFDGKDSRTEMYYPLVKGRTVEYGQGLALIDPELAFREVETKDFKKRAADADYTGTVLILSEAKTRLDDLLQLKSQGATLVTRQELSDARAAVARYSADKEVKQQNKDVATSEYYQAKLILSQHYLKSPLPGKSEVKIVLKLGGEGVRAQEPIMQLWNLSQLRVEGSVDSKYYRTLRANKDALCYLEPSVDMVPARPDLLQAHNGEVTSVAVCADGQHFVSGGEDRLVYVWQRGVHRPVITLKHTSPVRTVTCSPKAMLVLAGCADGKITLWDVSAQPPKTVWSKEQHDKAVTAAAFSPDGVYFASGGEDSAIKICKTENGKEVFPFDADHGVDDPPQGTITALSITKQCTLIAAARDNTIRAWELHDKGAKKIIDPIEKRGGNVSQLGVSADGRYMLFDKGNTLKLMNSADGAPVSVLKNLAGANPFDTLALFSPDGSMMLTGGAGEGRLHLWKTPTPQTRAFQIRELVAKERTPITTAAFAPAGHRFAVSGSKDGYVQVWTLPDEATVKNHAIRQDAKNKDLRLELVEQAIDAGKTGIAVIVQNPVDASGEFRLTPGQRVTLVVVLPVNK